MDLEWVLSQAAEKAAADIFIVPGYYISLKIGGAVTPISRKRLSPEACEALLREIYRIDSDRPMDRLLETGDDDFSFSVKTWRFRL